MDAQGTTAGPDPARVVNLDDLVRELNLLRSRAARGTRSARVSLEELAGRVGEPKSTIHAYLTGKRLAPAQLLDRMVIALGTTPAVPTSAATPPPVPNIRSSSASASSRPVKESIAGGS